MSQQEFEAQQQRDARSQAEEETYGQSRLRSDKKRTGAMPKEEHPSTYEKEMPIYGYRAQDMPGAAPAGAQSTQKEQSSSNRRRESWARRREFSPDGDAFETGYRPYQQRGPVPIWARPRQRTRNAGWMIILVIVTFMLLPVLVKVIGILLGVLAFFFFGFLFLALLLVAIVGLIYLVLRRSLPWPRRTTWW